jgi:hypothetical protein
MTARLVQWVRLGHLESKENVDPEVWRVVLDSQVPPDFRVRSEKLVCQDLRVLWDQKERR